MQKHSTHVIDEQAVHFFKGSLPPEHWTVYDIRPDYGKDHKVELVEGGEHTGLSFWVQVKGQKKVKKLKDGTLTSACLLGEAAACWTSRSSNSWLASSWAWERGSDSPSSVSPLASVCWAGS